MGVAIKYLEIQDHVIEFYLKYMQGTLIYDDKASTFTYWVISNANPLNGLLLIDHSGGVTWRYQKAI